MRFEGIYSQLFNANLAGSCQIALLASILVSGLSDFQIAAVAATRMEKIEYIFDAWLKPRRETPLTTDTPQ